MFDTSRLRIAIQKSGRLTNDSQQLLEQCGIKINLQQQRLLAFAENMPIDIMRVRDDDIPGLVIDGVADLGITGENVLKEELLTRLAHGKPFDYRILRQLDFGHCRLSIALPIDAPWTGYECLRNKRIATSYPNLLKQHLDKFRITFKSCLLNGSVEVAPNAGLSDVICDLVSTGATLKANGLREVEEICAFQACLIQSKNTLSVAKISLVDKLLSRIKTVIEVKEAKYIILICPTERIDDIMSILSDVKNPRILSLEGDEGHVMIHMISRVIALWDNMERLRDLGAKSILVLPIEKIIN